ncbi:hypothetical protein [Roseateles sp. PN1]|uniref:hypothetical protein n=1 Tax=Roseateles sp. PN1 TaxID=3137372 RepID=UPI00313A0EBE
MEILYTAVKTALAIFVMTLIVPLMVWGGSGSWRHALHALKWYWIIMGAMVLIVSTFAGFAVLMEFIG